MNYSAYLDAQRELAFSGKQTQSFREWKALTQFNSHVSQIVATTAKSAKETV